MGTLDAYIFKKAFSMWVGALLSLAGLILLSEFFGNLSKFSEHDVNAATIFAFMMLSLPQILYLVLPFSVCLGILAAQASFSRHVETIAMQASSVSDKQIYKPFISLGLLATLLMALLSFYAYPLAQKQADRIENFDIKKMGIKGSFTVSGCRFQAQDALYSVEHMDISAGLMQNISCYRMDSGRLAQIVVAKSAHWNGRGWDAHGMTEISLTAPKIIVKRGDGILPLKSAPEDLVSARPTPDVLTIGELRQYLIRLREDGIRSRSLETYFHSRISFAIAPIIMTLLVLPFGMRFPRTGGIAHGIALGLMLGLLYWGLHSGMTSAGETGYVRPVLAAWSANILALMSGLVLIHKRRGAYG